LNTILWDNNGEVTGGSIAVNYSCIKGGYTGTGNIADDPLFVRNSQPSGDDNLFGTYDDGLRLENNSPCKDVGDETVSPELDIIGISRTIGGMPDIGAYEIAPVMSGGSDILGRLDGSGEFTPISGTPILKDLSDPWDIRIAAGSNASRVVRLEITKNKYLDDKDSFYANVVGLDASGNSLPGAKHIRVTFYKVGSNKDNYIYQSKTASKGKYILFSSNDALQGTNQFAHVIYMVSNKLHYEVPGDQF